MNTNADITLYNAYLDSDDNTKYARTVIKNVSWQDEIKSTVTDKGLQSANAITVFIPVTSITKTYIEPKAYSKLSDFERSNYFTLKAEDKIIKGIYESNINGVKDFNKLDNIATIQVEIDNRIGSLSMQHWEVGCV